MTSGLADVEHSAFVLWDTRSGRGLVLVIEFEDLLIGGDDTK
jgi:hypothetical protein